jgi:hypothetical protein
MKKIVQVGIIAVAASVLLFACEKSDEEVRGESLTLTGPTEKVVLVEANAKNTAITFTWNKGIERNPTDTITYIFRMDIAGNNFATATPRDTVTNFTKSFTTGELSDLIAEQWQIRPGEEVLLEARVVANVRGEKFVYPEIATTTFSVLTYAYGSVPLYLKGTANTGSSPIALKEVINGRMYKWDGDLEAGGYKFVYDLENDLPSLNKGADGNTLVERTDAGQPDDLFEITAAGRYGFTVNRKEMTLNARKFQHYFERIYFVGDAIPAAAWDIGKAVEVTWEDGFFVYKGQLKGDGDGEDAFKIHTEKDWSASSFRPATDWASITDNRLEFNAPGDRKWKIKPEETGNYHVTLDMSEMTITFKKVE